MRIVLLLLIAGLLCPSGASAYAVKVHQSLSREALGEGAFLTTGTVDAPRGSDLSRFRAWLHEQISRHPDAALRQRFLARYPTLEAFGALPFRAFLAFNRSPRRRIYGLDRSGRGGPAREVLAFASGAPDLDGRNRDRVEYDAGGRPVKDANGDPIPDDPATLNMGASHGLSSQAHAHYGLPQVELSSDPDVLQNDPARFAVAAGWPDGPILSLAPEMAQLHTDLAILAHLWGGRGGKWLTTAFAGHAFHYLQDVGNQIHTVQVGLYDFFVDAKLQYWWRAFVTSGGTLAQLDSFTTIGIGILRNHHILIEQLTAIAYLDGSLQPDLATDDPALTGPGTGSDFGERIVRALIDLSAPEGAEAYGLSREIACGRLRSYGYTLPDDTDKRTIDYQSVVCDPARLPELMALQKTAMRRVATAMRAYDRGLAATLAKRDRDALKHEVLARFVTARLDLLDAADARRAAWIESPPEKQGAITSWGWPIGQALVFALVVYLVAYRGPKVQVPVSEAEAA